MAVDDQICDYCGSPVLDGGKVVMGVDGTEKLWDGTCAAGAIRIRGRKDIGR